MLSIIPKRPDFEISPTLQAMIDLRNHKDERYTVTAMKQWFPITELTSPTWIGSFAWTSTASHQKWMLQKTALLYGSQYSTPADAARDYIETRYSKKLRVTTAQYQAITKERHAPLYANPCTLDHGVYVDLKSAYWSIVKSVGWDVDYNPMQWLMVRSDSSDFPFSHNKLARNSLVSLAASYQSRLWTGTQLVVKRTGNQHMNKVLYALVMDVLNGIAWDMIKAGAVYVHTDGYIFPAARVGAAFEVLAAWGMVGGIKAEGYTKVYMAGTYDCGTWKHKRAIRDATHYHHSVYEPGNWWLRPRIHSWASRRL